MIGRGVYGRPWIAAAIARALENGGEISEPGAGERLEIILAHFADALCFYGDALGLRTFRKHLGWYVETAPLALPPDDRRAAKSALCRMDRPQDVEAGLVALWSGEGAFRLAA